MTSVSIPIPAADMDKELIVTLSDVNIPALHLTPAALDLLGLLFQREIPVVKCDLRPKNELTRAGLAERINVLTNSRRTLGEASYTSRCLALTEKGRMLYHALHST